MTDENALRESEARYRLIAEHMADVIWVLDVATQRFTYVSPSVKKLRGYTAEEILSQPMSEALTPESEKRVLERMASRIRQFLSGVPTPLSFVDEVDQPCRDGSIVHTEVTTTYLFNALGQLEIVGVSRDITDRKKSENALLESEGRYRGLFSEMKSGCTLQQIVFDKDGTPCDYYTLDMNPAAEKILGLNKEMAVGKPVSSLLPPDEFKTWLTLFGKVAVEGVPEKYEQYSPHNGKHFEGHVFCPKPGQFAVIFDDVTAQKKTEEVLRNAQKLESLGLLAGGIAHDFNNLLAGVFGYIDLAHGDSTSKRVSANLAKALSTIDRARGLTQQLLTFAKGGAPVKETGPLFPIVQETAQFALSGSHVCCTYDIQEALWQCSFDKSQIGQVIDNLVINAQQAMPVGGVIRMTAQNISFEENAHPALAKGNYVRISIRDSGIGISAELLPRIFDPFFTTKAKGHGLGLATSYSIVKRHGGVIEAESEPGKGSTFHVYLPASAEPVSHSSKGLAEKHAGRGVFIVMDDEQVIRETVGDMLKSFGYTAVCKENGRDTIDFFSAEMKEDRLPVGIILDLTIPGGMGGRNVAAEIRNLEAGAARPNVPIFVSSGYAEDPVMAQPREYGFTASICKPFRKADLAKMLNTHMKVR